MSSKGSFTCWLISRVTYQTPSDFNRFGIGPRRTVNMDVSLLTSVYFFNTVKQLIGQKLIVFCVYETIEASLVGDSRFCVDLNLGTPMTLQPGGSDSTECPRDSY